MHVGPDEFAELLGEVVPLLNDVGAEDWSKPAGNGLEWTCWQTVDHTIDVLFSYSLQLASQTRSGFLPFSELRAQPNASAFDLIAGLEGVGTMFLAVARTAPTDAVASDGVRLLSSFDWCARAAYELVLHTYDVLSGLGVDWEPPADLCRSIVSTESLWMLDRDVAGAAPDPWTALLLGSGRPGPSGST